MSIENLSSISVNPVETEKKLVTWNGLRMAASNIAIVSGFSTGFLGLALEFTLDHIVSPNVSNALLCGGAFTFVLGKCIEVKKKKKEQS